MEFEKISEKNLISQLRELIKTAKWRRATSPWFRGELAHEYVTKDQPKRYNLSRTSVCKLYELMKEYILRHGKVELFGKKRKISVYAILDGYKYWFDPTEGLNIGGIRPVLNRKPLKGYKKKK